MKNNLSGDIQLLENLCEVSDEAKNILNKLNKMVYPQIASIMSRYGVKMYGDAYPVKPLKTQGFDLRKPTVSWKIVFQNSNGTEKTLKFGKSYSVAEAFGELGKLVYKKYKEARWDRKEELYITDQGNRILIRIGAA